MCIAAVIITPCHKWAETIYIKQLVIVDCNYSRGETQKYIGWGWKPALNGKLQLNKGSLGEKYTNGNQSYSLDGAQYKVTDKTGKQVGVLTTNNKGVSNTLELPIGVYIVKEIKAPAGYNLDPTEYKVKVKN